MNENLQPGAAVARSGLTELQVLSSREKSGRNVIRSNRAQHTLTSLWNIVREPMFIVLIIACSIYFFTGEISEGFLMLGAMVFVAAISFYQEARSARALLALNSFTEQKTTVIRNSLRLQIDSEDLVPGDLIFVSEGERIPADSKLIESAHLSCDESMLTGESLPVSKGIANTENTLFLGTSVNSGNGLAVVTGTGSDSSLGRMGIALNVSSASTTPLQRQINIFVKGMSIFGFVVFLVIWAVNFMEDGSIIQSLLFGLTIVMAIIPEEIPVAFSSFMALGALHMAKVGIITRSPLTIENVGDVSVICLDKTGTLTENRMTLFSVYDFGTDTISPVTDDAGLGPGADTLRFARLASEPEPYDPMEVALLAACKKLAVAGAGPTERVRAYPLEGIPPMMSQSYEKDGISTIFGKGAPERIMNVCHLRPEEKLKVQAALNSMAALGLRVLGVCSAPVIGNKWPENQDSFDWRLQGLLSFYDPPKKEVGAELEKWYRAGIKVKMITGDYKETAQFIAAKVGMRSGNDAMTGDEVTKSDKTDFRRLAEDTVVFARMFPEGKLEIINALKANGEIVAMLGDGVNDGLALKAADIGIAMGGRGTEMARQAADLVLTDDRLERVTEAILQGRTIYLNLKKAIRYIISIHVPIILVASLPLLLAWRMPNLFSPIHVIFLELIMGPTCSIFFEREPAESWIMEVGPRKKTRALFTVGELTVSLMQGFVISAGLLGIFYFLMSENYPVEYVRTAVFITILLCNVFLTFINRSFEETIARTSRRKNVLTPYLLTGSAVFISAIYFVPGLRRLFDLVPVRQNHLLLCLLVSIISTGWFELYKVIRTKKPTAE